MAAQSKTRAWLEGDAEAMRERHVARLRTLFTETHNANEALRVDLCGQIYQLTFDYTMSETQLRARVDRAGAAFVEQVLWVVVIPIVAALALIVFWWKRSV